jgi:uncharacterized membrane protein
MKSTYKYTIHVILFFVVAAVFLAQLGIGEAIIIGLVIAVWIVPRVIRARKD